MANSHSKSTSSSSPNEADLESLAEWQVAIIDLFVHAVQALGLPKSVGQIYGLLFGVSEPATMEFICRHLGISMGSASQGLRLLRQLGAVKTVFVVGTRREHFVAERSIRRFGSGFITEVIEPHLQSGNDRLSHLKHLTENEQNETAGECYDMLKSWHSKASKLLPIIRNFL